MKNKDIDEKQLYIPFPNLTARQEKLVGIIGAFVIAILIAIIVFMMYATQNPDVIFDKISRPEQTTVAEATTYVPPKEHTTAYKGRYEGGIYEPTEEPETTIAITQKHNENVITGNETTTATEFAKTTATITTEPTTKLPEETTTQKSTETTTLTAEENEIEDI